jgi:hypothetical protein
VEGTGTACEEGKCDTWYAEGGRRSRIRVEALWSNDPKDEGVRGFRPGLGEGDVVEEASGEGAFDPVTIGGERMPPNTFFGKEALRLANAGGRGGFGVGEVDIADDVEAPDPLSVL